MLSEIDAILVPAGAEYKAVCQGLSRLLVPAPPVFPIPVGCQPLTLYLETWLQAKHLKVQQPKVLLMGLCGSLTPSLGVGDVVLYQHCVSTRLMGTCRVGTEDSASMTAAVVDSAHPTLSTCRVGTEDSASMTAAVVDSAHPTLRISLVTGLTSDRIISSAEEKRYLGEKYQAEVVDMEGFAALEILSQAGVAVAMLRVVSDGCDYNIPDLTGAITPDGVLKPLPIAIKMLRQPLAATRLIKGSLRGLQVLRGVTKSLFSE